LESKVPHLLQGCRFEVSHWQVEFDWIFVFALVNHLTPELQALAFRNLARVLSPTGRIVISPPLEGPQNDLLRETALVETHREVRCSVMLPDELHWMEVEPS
jgi:hypothetical protein